MQELTIKLNKIQSKYESAVDGIAKIIENNTMFCFSLQWQLSDGWTIVSDDAKVAPVDECLKLIQEKGQLSYDDFLRKCI